MAHTPHDIRDFLEEELSYPIEIDTVLEHIGDERIEAPNVGESESIHDLLDGVGVESFESADELNDTIHAMLPDEYIGRKYYDDRGDARGDTRQDEKDQSF